MSSGAVFSGKAQERILGAALIDNSRIAWLNPDHFSGDLAEVAAAMRRLFDRGETVDVVSLWRLEGVSPKAVVRFVWCAP